VLDWTGQPEPDFEWLIDVGKWFDKESPRLLRNPVQTTAAVITDFDQRAALSVYKHVPASQEILPQAFDALHRLGTGVDALNVETAARPGALSKYSLVVIPAATSLDNSAVPDALKAYVTNGGNVVITPLTAYQSVDGVFRGDGFGRNLRGITGASARTARRMGTSADKGRSDQHVTWLDTTSPVGIDGYCEYLDVDAEAEVIGRFQSDEPVLNGQPAAVRRKIGKGTAIKLAFWPKDDSVVKLFQGLLPGRANPLASPLAPGVQAVPRTDHSLFVVNTSPRAAAMQLARPVTDRISGRKFAGNVDLKAYEVVWLE
jgi:beta-galactosidase